MNTVGLKRLFSRFSRFSRFLLCVLVFGTSPDKHGGGWRYLSHLWLFSYPSNKHWNEILAAVSMFTLLFIPQNFRAVTLTFPLLCRGKWWWWWWGRGRGCSELINKSFTVFIWRRSESPVKERRPSLCLLLPLQAAEGTTHGLIDNIWCLFSSPFSCFVVEIKCFC